ncbi:hypothetical protein Btru_032742 [Bulinus truncatus]|nr:hypothetical protein Btru_032742 [Bulinus truncatus]
MFKAYKNLVKTMASTVPKENQLPQVFLGNTGLKVSNLCLGTMTFGESFFPTPGQCDEATSHQLINRYVEWGGNFLDTADIYGRGNSEKIVGSWVSNKREKISLSLQKFVSQWVLRKTNNVELSRRHITTSIDNSLSRLRTNYVDLYQEREYVRGNPSHVVPSEAGALFDLVRSLHPKAEKQQPNSKRYSIWIDFEDMPGNLLEGMSKAVERSWLVLICISKKYQDSPNCRTNSILFRDASRILFSISSLNLAQMAGNNFTPNGNHFAPNGNHFAPNGNHFAPYGNHFAPNGNHFAPNGNHFAPYGNHFAPYGNHFAPNGNHFAPYGNRELKDNEK